MPVLACKNVHINIGGVTMIKKLYLTIDPIILIIILVLCCNKYTYAASPITEIKMSHYSNCSNATDDDRENLIKALQDAKNNKAILNIDCSIKVHIGMDIENPIFIYNGTNITFSNNSSITVDNVFVPAFIIANTSDVHISNGSFIYDAQTPIDDHTHGYYMSKVWVPMTGDSPPANAFNNVTVSQWLTKNRGINFSQDIFAFWTGILDPEAIFYISGDSSNLSFNKISIKSISPNEPYKYVPIAFSLLPGYKSNQNVTASTTPTAQYMAVPNHISFTNITLDGILFGWHGTTQNTIFDNITSLRYSDLQDENGNNVGGVNKWFSPPHLFYINYETNLDPALYNSNLTISNIDDEGIRLGVARDKDTVNQSGYLDSLKIEALNSSVDHYISWRPDGFADIMTSSNLSISNVQARYDSSFLNNLYPIMRFPCFGDPYHGYQNITFRNIQLTDTAVTTIREPIDGNYDSRNSNISIDNLTIHLNNWGTPQKEVFSPLVSGSPSYINGTNANPNYNVVIGGSGKMPL